MNKQKYLFIGAAVAAGLFVGLAIGLSRSPIIAAVTGAVVPLIMFVATGIVPGSKTRPVIAMEDVAAFVMVFFVVAMLGAGGGLLIRTGSSVLVAIDQDLASLGFTAEDRRDIISNAMENGWIKLGAQDTGVPVLFGYPTAPAADAADPRDVANAAVDCSQFGSPPWSLIQIGEMVSRGQGVWQLVGNLFVNVSAANHPTQPPVDAVQTAAYRLIGCVP